MKINDLASFWERHPSLLYALSLLPALHENLFPISLIAFGTPLLIIAFYGSKRLLIHLGLAFLLGCTSFLYVNTSAQFLEIPDEKIEGTALVELSSLSIKKTPFGKRWIYKGKLVSFFPDGSSEKTSAAYGIPITIQLPFKERADRPSANKNYIIHGSLAPAGNRHYTLLVKNEEPWLPTGESILGLAENRFWTKQKVKEYIQHKIKQPQAANFLGGIATGDFDDRHLQYEFGRFGLQHILAISGFHFSMIAGILSFLLHFLLPRKFSYVVLIMMITLYFFFLGATPSILRSWISISIVLFGYLLSKRSNGLNTLGLAFIAIFIIDPLLCTSLGFQLSFICTASILFFFTPCDLLLQGFWQKRSLSLAVRMDRFNQHGFLCLSFFRQMIALTIAVHLIAIPLTLFYFSKFPVMGLIYNLFFPFLVSISMLLLLLGFILDLIIPPLGLLLHSINGYFSQALINMTFNMPKDFDIYLTAPDISSTVMCAYLCLMLWIGIYFRIYVEKKLEELQDFAFL